MRDVIAILCSDIHLSQDAPIARAGEESWYDAMSRPLDQLGLLAAKYSCPIICAGDVFHRWKSPPELINFALEYLPDMYAIPGQHDLPYHNYDEMHKSAFYTLVEAGKIKLLDPEEPTQLGGLVAFAFPWGRDVVPSTCFNTDAMDGVFLAVVHAYIWAKGHNYTGAPDNTKVGAYKKALMGYDTAVFGDNHKGFAAKAGNCRVVNTGGFMRRDADQADYQPSVHLLHDDGSTTKHDIITDDVISDAHLLQKPVQQSTDKIDDFMAEIKQASDTSLSFRDALSQYFDNNRVTKGAKRKLMEALDG